jgi:hypothetical protein
MPHAELDDVAYLEVSIGSIDESVLVVELRKNGVAAESADWAAATPESERYGQSLIVRRVAQAEAANRDPAVNR